MVVYNKLSKISNFIVVYIFFDTFSYNIDYQRIKLHRSLHFFDVK